MLATQTQDRSLAQVTLYVIAIHALLILWVIFFAFSPHQDRKPTERLVVKTIQLSPPNIQTRPLPPPKVEKLLPQSAAIEPAPVPPVENIPEPKPLPPETTPQKVIEEPAQPEPIKPPEPVAKTPEPIKKSETPQLKTEKKVEVKKTKEVKKPSPKKTSEKKTVKKAEPEKQKAGVKKSTPSKEMASKKTDVKQTDKPKTDPKIAAAKAKAQQEVQEKQRKLIAAAQESIAKIDQGRAKISTAKSNLNNVTATPAAITSLQIDALPVSNAPPLTPGERSYRDEIASRLKLMLKLPEHGDVQLKLTLDRSGKAIKVVIVKSVSSANRSYVEKTLPNLKFPPLGSHFENMSEYTFIIQLSNEL